MFLTHAQLRHQLKDVIANKEEQGHVVTHLDEELLALPNSYDALYEFAQRLSELPLREDWPFHEPDELEDIWAACDPNRPLGATKVDLNNSAQRVEAAFLGSVCGCVLGKPVEINPTLEQLRTALEPLGAWPINDYLPAAALDSLPRRHESWPNTTRGNIHFVEPDDDMNYTILGMLVLEKHGASFTRKDVRDAWLHHMVTDTAWGPERTVLAKAAANALSYGGDHDASNFDEWVRVLNPGMNCAALKFVPTPTVMLARATRLSPPSSPGATPALLIGAPACIPPCGQRPPLLWPRLPESHCKSSRRRCSLCRRRVAFTKSSVIRSVKSRNRAIGWTATIAFTTSTNNTRTAAFIRKAARLSTPCVGPKM
jgi:hypothetical protein